MAKKKTLSKLVNEAAELLQLLCRLEAADDNGYVQCVSCGEIRHYKDGMQGGHFVSRGKAATKLVIENINPQCNGCNMYGMRYHDAEKEYTLWMQKKHGLQFVEDLIAMSKTTHKFIRTEVEDLIAETKEKIKFHKKRVGDG